MDKVKTWATIGPVGTCTPPLPPRWINRHKFPLYIPVGVVSSLLLTGVVSLCFLHVSRHNYPGGHALSCLHTLVDDDMEHKLGKQGGVVKGCGFTH